MSIILRGMTWSHPRGYDPLVTCARLWQQRTGVQIDWDKRSLQDFESYPVEELAARYDLIVIDHPHVGQITAENCLLPLDMPGRQAEAQALAAGSVGASYPSYTYAGRQWAFPIDAATQVQAWRPDLLSAPLSHWDDVLTLARQGAVLCPLRSPHTLMSLYTLTGNLGAPPVVDGSAPLFAPSLAAVAYDQLAALADLIDPACFDWDPIAVFEAMAAPEARIACAPLIYGYVSYAAAGFRPHRIAFADMPGLGAAGPVGSALGGTGIAVSARTQHPEAAIDFAYWVAGAEAQAGLYAEAGGQPGHAAAWDSKAVNEPVGQFYRNTRATLEGAWLRPRHDGYMPFQHEASERLRSGLMQRAPAAAVIADLNALYRSTLP
ncbi:extracellular solute-binding protein [Acidisoma cellulosilytica]|uniref:Extracellular solute-binding protein n=1 Tax=Acidisoma cellulosilyticum TaxID=2802395 RepID=A0A964E4B9_9PROT|nr:extracellular solute-binding protein [Acidisoma cellulosilyticum]MCB8881132.1 extracellular solute-binding protein [Acidisoma cellulosilyticum]